jgi:hypothetical protein
MNLVICCDAWLQSEGAVCQIQSGACPADKPLVVLAVERGEQATLPTTATAQCTIVPYLSCCQQDCRGADACAPGLAPDGRITATATCCGGFCGCHVANPHIPENSDPSSVDYNPCVVDATCTTTYPAVAAECGDDWIASPTVAAGISEWIVTFGYVVPVDGGAGLPAAQSAPPVAAPTVELVGPADYGLHGGGGCSASDEGDGDEVPWSLASIVGVSGLFFWFWPKEHRRRAR